MRDTLGSYRSMEALTDEQLHKVAPSIFTLDSYSKRMSDRYSQLATIQVVNGLRANGFMPFSVAQSPSRGADGHMFAKHMVRFRHASVADRMLDTEYDEIVLINSHDGSSALELMQGVFRFICLNGMIDGSTTASISIKHSGDIVSNVIEGATRILENSGRAIETRESMRAIELDTDERRAFGEAALALRYNGKQSPVTIDSILTPRRPEDNKMDLWTTLNVTQENMIRGGLSGRSVKTGRRSTTRGITGISQDVGVNRMLWNLAEAARNMASTLDLIGEVTIDEVDTIDV